MYCIITTRNMNTLKAEMHLILCPNVTRLKRKNRCVLMKQQLCLETSCDLVVDSPTQYVFKWKVCGNKELASHYSEWEQRYGSMSRTGWQRLWTCVIHKPVHTVLCSCVRLCGWRIVCCASLFSLSVQLNNCIERDLSRYCLCIADLYPLVPGYDSHRISHCFTRNVYGCNVGLTVVRRRCWHLELVVCIDDSDYRAHLVKHHCE